MPRLFAFIVWFLVSFTVLGGLHAYLWTRLVRDTGLPSHTRIALTCLLALLALLMPVTFITARSLGSPWREFLAWSGFTWMGVMFLLFVLLVSWDVGRLVAWLAVRLSAVPYGDPDPGRRLALARIVASTSVVGAIGLGMYALRCAVRLPELKRIRVELPRLPQTLSGFAIVQISDLHVGPTIGRTYVEEVVRRVNDAQPELVAITGDLVDGGVGDLREDVAPLAGLKARHGVYFVTGNHEYYAGVSMWLKELERLGIRVLRNERVSIGDSNGSFDLAGVDDYRAARMEPGHGPDLQRAVNGRDPGRELVLLAHQPAEFDNAVKHGVGLQLSGHTHGGQIFPFTWLVRLVQPVVAGLRRQGDTQIYVSRGTGYWGPPMRLGAPSEITRVELLPPVPV